MNVLGKIKSKRQNASNTQVQKVAHQKQEPQNNISESQHFECYQTQIPQQQLAQKTNESIKVFKPMKPVQEFDYITNTNVLSKQKENAFKEKQSCFPLTRDSSTFLNSYKTYKPSKNSNPIVYYDSNPSCRSSSFQIDQSSSNLSSKLKKRDSFESEEEQAVDFQFLLTNKKKKQVRTMLSISKGKVQNSKEIQNDLKAQNQQVLRFYVKKWFSYGDIYMLDGQLESLKKGYLTLDSNKEKNKVYKKIRIKLSCGRDVIDSPQTMKIIYLSQVSFLSQTQGMIMHDYFLKAIERNRRFET